MISLQAFGTRQFLDPSIRLLLLVVVAGVMACVASPGPSEDAAPAGTAGASGGAPGMGGRPGDGGGPGADGGLDTGGAGETVDALGAASDAFAGGGAGGASMPLAAGLGVPCTRDSDCSGGAVCVNPSGALIMGDCQPGMLCTSVELTRAGLRWTGGYCATSCSASADCGASAINKAICLIHYESSRLILSPKVPLDRCVVECGPNDECPAGLTCSGGLICSNPTGAKVRLCLPCGATSPAGRRRGRRGPPR
jgi:hypothetical protein